MADRTGPGPRSPGGSATRLAHVVTASAKRLARRLKRAPFPKSLIPLAGTIPFRPISYRKYLSPRLRAHAPAPAPFVGAAPRGRGWRWSSPASLVMNHFVEIPRGVATNIGRNFDAELRFVIGASHRSGELPRTWDRYYDHGYVADREWRGRRVRSLRGRVAVLTHSAQGFYYHWLFDVLPKLEMLGGSGEASLPLYIQRRHPFQVETLEALGVGDDRVVSCDRHPLVSAESLTVPCFQIMNGFEFPGWVIEFLRGRFLPAATSAPAGMGRFYVSRSAASWRRLLNEEEIVSRLRRRGFAEVRSEELPFLAQVGLFAGAEAVVAPHGGGLANLVFSRPGTKVLELLPHVERVEVDDLFFRLSHAMRCEYGFVKAREATENLQIDFSVDPDEVEDALDALGVK